MVEVLVNAARHAPVACQGRSSNRPCLHARLTAKNVQFCERLYAKKKEPPTHLRTRAALLVTALRLSPEEALSHPLPSVIFKQNVVGAMPASSL